MPAVTGTNVRILTRRKRWPIGVEIALRQLLERQRGLGTRFTRFTFTSTKVQVLTQKAVLVVIPATSPFLLSAFEGGDVTPGGRGEKGVEGGGARESGRGRGR